MTYFQVAAGDVVGSVHMNTAINQGVIPFATAAERDAAIPSPTAGMHCFVNDLTVSVDGLTQQYEDGAWHVIAGDTGWRHMTGALRDGFLAYGEASYPPRIRRVGSEVHLRGLVYNPAVVSTGGYVMDIPVGFQNLYSDYYVTVCMSAFFGLAVSSTSLILDSSYTGVGGWLSVEHDWFTKNPWPTVLPGTAL